MTATRSLQAVMFADVSGSSRLYKEHGNTQAKQQIDGTLGATREIIESYEGVVIKTLGDEIMARFSSPEQACRAAIKLQRHALKYGQLSLRIGMAYGETLMDSTGDVFGQVVNDAADVSHIARANQVVLTDTFKLQLPPALTQQCERFDQVRLKGAEHSSIVYRLHWETSTHPQNATAVMDILSLTDLPVPQSLELHHDSRQQTINIDDLPLTIGRDESLVKWFADNTKVSREHCEIIYRRGKFVLIDHSTNGTYITQEQQELVYIRREETPLMGSGIITLGQRPDRAGAYSISFTINHSSS
ncbi:adenylate/guanylate cyclase domain-containing protein [Gilvimarinus agarilyticus]|uniref:adenylate/guanylate cyclase domain-containing protein n=1 Tax=Gilvimarinus sp. 2_MG-2023 TaxID=3062666 RepID=UPI001C0866B1|nr:adenylate/guanylate cyclase domain-containing protein [Gilvimarinus sp. 2_MG-2023]MBU2887328.1 adenylate/guanylate cyclase domain-containing protein [Gilvimarinus agarilyticus]MDO6571987.1 adenylate/guanylate cyclase domain-containing protein [Gilvimarinus sp. 2_MG-2023]